jgi:hypothetical protein
MKKLFPLLKSQSLVFFAFLDFQSNKGNKNQIFNQIQETKIKSFIKDCQVFDFLNFLT